MSITVETVEGIEVDVTVPTIEVDVTVPTIEVGVETSGPTGPPGQWVQVTQAEYDALDPPDPGTLFVVIG